MGQSPDQGYHGIQAERFPGRCTDQRIEQPGFNSGERIVRCRPLRPPGEQVQARSGAARYHGRFRHRCRPAPDGPYAGRGDDGEVRGYKGGTARPYYGGLLADPRSNAASPMGPATFSPNRVVVIVGSLRLAADRSGFERSMADVALPARSMVPLAVEREAREPALRIKVSARSPVHGPVLDAGGRALRDQRAVRDPRQDQHELPDSAVHLHQTGHGLARPVQE